MARCRDCGQLFKWISIEGRYEKYDFDGKSHQCGLSTQTRQEYMDPQNAICANCWLPLVSKSAQSCSCISPAPVDKWKAAELKAKKEAEEKKQLGDFKRSARSVLTCVFCESDAFRTGELVVCSKDPKHVMPSSYYDTSGSVKP
jgi:hypothetical protein